MPSSGTWRRVDYCVNRRFGGTHRLHLHGRKIRERGTNVSRWLQTEQQVENCMSYGNKKNRDIQNVFHLSLQILFETFSLLR
jgi:hypothetical protein